MKKKYYNDGDVIRVNLTVLRSWTMSWLVLTNRLFITVQTEVLVLVLVLGFCKDIGLFEMDRCNYC